ncbi:hypothetical protein PV04_03300 [Phialophora macrospora]|uniref:Uncharacterized protein n=1 Tax=Phialophora macrospora TaxID=1851006 RepID=A0A0D2E9W7_9EURO|nr:hypothetical protein PV04_03300 [Phialophora macrospora]
MIYFRKNLIRKRSRSRSQPRFLLGPGGDARIVVVSVAARPRKLLSVRSKLSLRGGAKRMPVNNFASSGGGLESVLSTQDQYRVRLYPFPVQIEVHAKNLKRQRLTAFEEREASDATLKLLCKEQKGTVFVLRTTRMWDCYPSITSA